MSLNKATLPHHDGPRLVVLGATGSLAPSGEPKHHDHPHPDTSADDALEPVSYTHLTLPTNREV